MHRNENKNKRIILIISIIKFADNTDTGVWITRTRNITHRLEEAMIEESAYTDGYCVLVPADIAPAPKFRVR